MKHIQALLEPLIVGTLSAARGLPRLWNDHGPDAFRLPADKAARDELVDQIRKLEVDLARSSKAQAELAEFLQRQGINVEGADEIARVASDYARCPPGQTIDLDSIPELKLPDDLEPY